MGVTTSRDRANVAPRCSKFEADVYDAEAKHPHIARQKATLQCRRRSLDRRETKRGRRPFFAQKSGRKF